MLEPILLFAQDVDRYNRGLGYFQWGLTGVGIAIILLGVGLASSKPKDPQQQSSALVRWSSLGICSAIGLGVIAYAWLGFGPQ